MEYNITKKYLTYAEIQNIVDQVAKSNIWSDRQQIIDMLVLCYCTDRRHRSSLSFNIVLYERRHARRAADKCRELCSDRGHPRGI